MQAHPTSPLQNCRRRWMAALRTIRAANSLKDCGAMSFAMRVLNRVRAEYQRVIRDAEGWLRYQQQRRAA